MIPGFTLALGFLLGGIISPPDAISATTIMRQVDVPKSVVSIAESESLLNDASSLIVFRFALATILTGQFHAGEAITSFTLVVLMGIGVGVLVGLIFYAIHRWLPTTPSIDIVLTLVTPYCMYYTAEHFHFSGVLSVVSGGLLLSNRRQSLLSYQSRIQGVNVWTNLVFVLNGLVFLLIGLQLPSISQQLGATSLWRAVGYGLAISLALIVIRLISTFGAVLFTRFISRFITVADSNPEWKGPLILGWAGMRGVVSLAAALSVPLLMNNGQPFPYRNLILFITFIVILVSLVVQGLSLPWLIRRIKLKDRFQLLSEPQQEKLVQQTLAQSSLSFLDTKLGSQTPADPLLTNLRERLTIDLSQLSAPVPGGSTAAYQQAYLELLAHQRDWLNELNQKAEFDEDLIRKYLSLVDIDELKIREKLGAPGEPNG